MTSPSPHSAGQFSLRELMIGVTVMGVLLAISRNVGGLGTGEIRVFVLLGVSTVLAQLGPRRMVLWLAIGVCLISPLGFVVPPTSIATVCGGVFLLYAFAGTPIAIAAAKGLRMKRWLISEFGVITVAIALTPADLITTGLVYLPLQLWMTVYAFFAKDQPLPGSDVDEQSVNGEQT